MTVSNSRTHPSSPVQSTPKQALQNYVESMQTIVKGYQLDKKENLHERLYSNLMVALSNAEARINAPNAASESFDPQLKSLQSEVLPVLRNRFGTTDVSQIVAGIGKQPLKQPAQPAPAPSRTGGIGKLLDQAYAGTQRSSESRLGGRTDTQKFQSLNSMVLGEEARLSPRDSLRNAFTAPGTVSNVLANIDRAYDSLQAAKSKGPNLRLSPSIGKTVEVTGSTDLTRAFQRMEMICTRNQVRKDVARQRYHVRRGQLKKNNRIARWRKLFNEGFLAECGRVRRMRRQGW